MMTDEEEEFSVGREDRSGRKISSPSEKFQSMALMTIEKGAGDGKYPLGASAMSAKTDDPEVTAMSGLEMVSLKLESPLADTIYDIKHQLRKEIGRFGGKYERIFKLLDMIRDPPEVRKEMFEFAIKEATRYKRKHLIQKLEKVLDKMHSEHLLNIDEQTTSV